ncbi:MAG: hypothetical protein Roseis2KO_25460 [Roseivirga sp.]
MKFVSEEVIRSLGLTLLDSLWQGAALLFACGGLLWLLRNRASRTRYYVILAGLLALPVLSVVTFMGHYTVSDQAVAASAGQRVLPSGFTFATGETVLPVSALSLVDRWQQWAQINAPYISLIWVLGFALFAFRLTGGFYMVNKLKRHSQKPLDDYWMTRMRSMREQLKIKLPVELRQSARLTSPIVLGYLKPVIIFPMGLLQGLPTDQIEAILLHELAHIKRYDYLLNVLVSLLQVVFFYHPAYWWLQSQLDSEREYSCDDMVLHQTGNSLSLIKALAAVREFQISGHSPALAFAGQKNQLLKRVERIMKKKTRTNWLGGLISMSVLLLSFFLMSYQSREGSQNSQKVDEPVIDSTKTVKTYFSLPEPKTNSIKYSALNWAIDKAFGSDTITLEQAILDLLDTDASDIMLETDDKGNLLTIKKGGKELSGDDLKVYKKAHARLQKYARNEKALTESARELEMRLKEREQVLYELRSKEKFLEQQLVEYETNYNRMKTLELYQKSLKERQNRITEQKDLEKSKSELVESLKTREKALHEYTEFLRRYDAIRAEFEELNMQQKQAQIQRKRDILEEYKAMLFELRNQNLIRSSKFEFSGDTRSQHIAADLFARYRASVEKPLIVVDEKVYENWSFADLDQIDRSRKIETIDVNRDDIPAKYDKLMNGRDVLVMIVTSPGKKGYVRPKIDLAPDNYDKQIDLERQEVFSKQLLSSLEEEQLLKDGWKTVKLSTESLLIDDKKQSKKTLKKYLRLYEETMGKPLSKNTTVELKE